jgi:hypothetical protein
MLKWVPANPLFSLPTCMCPCCHHLSLLVCVCPCLSRSVSRPSKSFSTRLLQNLLDHSRTFHKLPRAFRCMLPETSRDFYTLPCIRFQMLLDPYGTFKSLPSRSFQIHAVHAVTFQLVAYIRGLSPSMATFPSFYFQLSCPPGCCSSCNFNNPTPGVLSTARQPCAAYARRVPPPARDRSAQESCRERAMSIPPNRVTLCTP